MDSLYEAIVNVTIEVKTSIRASNQEELEREKAKLMTMPVKKLLKQKSVFHSNPPEVKRDMHINWMQNDY